MPKLHKEDYTDSVDGLLHVGCASHLYDLCATVCVSCMICEHCVCHLYHMCANCVCQLYDMCAVCEYIRWAAEHLIYEPCPVCFF